MIEPDDIKRYIKIVPTSKTKVYNYMIVNAKEAYHT